MDLNPNHLKNTDHKIMDLENQVDYLQFLLQFRGDRHQGEGGGIENWRLDRIAGGRSWRNEEKRASQRMVFELRGRSNGRILINSKFNYCDGKIFKTTKFFNKYRNAPSKFSYVLILYLLFFKHIYYYFLREPCLRSYGWFQLRVTYASSPGSKPRLPLTQVISAN